MITDFIFPLHFINLNPYMRQKPRWDDTEISKPYIYICRICNHEKILFTALAIDDDDDAAAAVDNYDDDSPLFTLSYSRLIFLYESLK
jgi:hypothetical protein